MSSLIELSGLFTELKGSLELPKTPTHVAPDLAVCLHMSQLDLTLLGGFLLSFCPLFSMFELTLWGSRNSVAGRAVHHSLQTGVGRQEKEPLRCMHPLGVFLTSQHMNNTCHRDMLIFPAQALAWSQHTLPIAFSCTSFTLYPPYYSSATMNPTRKGPPWVTSTLMLWKDCSACQQRYSCKDKD